MRPALSDSRSKVPLGRIVAFAEIEKFLDTPVKRYSSGRGRREEFVFDLLDKRG